MSGTSRAARDAQRLRCVVGLVLALSGGVAAACGPPETARLNLVLIVVDTLRADRLGSYGGRRDNSPALDALAADAARFERAYATAPWTQPSVASLFTGLHPRRHGLVRVGLRLPPELPTLAGILSESGYATAGVVSHQLLGRLYGFDRGFDRFDQSEGRGHEYVSTPGVTAKAVEALDALAAGGAPFFLFVHYFDPHHSYQRHPEIGFAPAEAGRLAGGETIRQLKALRPGLTPGELAFVKDVYDEEIRFTDDGIGQLLTALRRAGVYDDSVIVMTADHGEEFREHGRLGHVRTLFEELVRVPLIIRVPGITDGGRVIGAPVSSAGVMATVLELLELGEAEPAGRAGSLAAHLRPAATAPPGDTDPVFLEVAVDPPNPGRPGGLSVHLDAVVSGGYKLIRDDRSGAVALFALDRDPEERRNIAQGEPAVVRDLARALDHHRAEPRTSAPEVAIPEDAVGRLRALGYLDP